ncbi:ribonuclease HI family protein [Salsuginibacillus kocurii]|uniref:ribonuclease HI family protein n=1 Tax=Salsuginibacillus kocurii TaxID=427078 RepID=UPI00035FCFCA|nr:ribonuclease HI family protein [Salsuginibacillus kocurii]
MLHIYVDGASSGDPGHSGAGVFIKYENGDVYRKSYYLGANYSNHEAEFLALQKGLEYCVAHGITEAMFYTDSQLVDDAANHGKVDNPAYKPYLKEILLLSADLSLFFVKWIPGRTNKEADYLAKQGIQKQ